jgi:hypothetical protein
MELFALAFALLQAARLGEGNQSVRLRGDSITVLAWAQDNRFNSELAMAASTLVLGICQHFDLVDTHHLGGELGLRWVITGWDTSEGGIYPRDLRTMGGRAMV